MGAHLLIDTLSCIGCDLCRQVCIRDNIGIIGGKATELESGKCFDCGHCMAVCPRGAVSLVRYPGVTPESLVFPEGAVDPGSLMALLSERRSLRWFTDEPVSDDEFRLLFDAAGLSPTAQNAMDVEFVVVDGCLEEFLTLLAEILQPLSDDFPRIGQFVEYMGSEDRTGPNPFLWEGRQVILAFSEEPVNGAIAMARVELMAQAMGLGGFYSLWMSKADQQDHGGFMSFFPDLDPRKRLGAVFVIGHPRIAYRRMAPRSETRVHRM